ncbi:hypothetical protein [Streptomyces sp. CC224B]|uniref:hypothetical protein n=1 Tax=Streptomyces sp. CC224B TaxID=3044571 RepID=UPI0024A7F291|nr:hypothetical protein [Streptomyces sp. CC224B]
MPYRHKGRGALARVRRAFSRRAPEALPTADSASPDTVEPPGVSIEGSVGLDLSPELAHLIALVLENRLPPAETSQSTPTDLLQAYREVLDKTQQLEQQLNSFITPYLPRLKLSASDIDPTAGLASLAISYRGLVSAVEDEEDLTRKEEITAEEAQLAADAAAKMINKVLARLFLRLGPPPENASGDYMPVSSGGGGAQQ